MNATVRTINDLHFMEPLGGPAYPDGGEPWPEPLPLGDGIAGEAYPADALPPIIADAVQEVRAFVQAPLALVAGSALATLSLACQALADVERMPGLSGPCSLFMLAVAESGERKTSCDGHFGRAVEDWEREAEEREAPAVKLAQDDADKWLAKRAGCLEGMKVAAKGGKSTDALEARLADLGERPALPRVPTVRRLDDTPESLARKLATEWPSAAVMASEAGLVLGGHAMGEGSITRNLSLFNVLWEGGTVKVGRASKDSFRLRGARLTVGLLSQAATLRAFVFKSGDLARGTGFLARFLVSWPASTMGTRMIRNAPAHWPALGTFNGRIRALLDMPTPIGDDGGLTPPALALAPAAHSIWEDYANDVERELRNGGECADVRDVASKSADNAARLACLFHILQHGPHGLIGDDPMRRGCELAAWHLGESRRLLADVSPPKRFADALALDAWLAQRCAAGEAVPAVDVLRYGPNTLRTASARDAALDVLTKANRVRRTETGAIIRNPVLIGE